jgi:predicted RND superfamily exporter protein
VVGRLRPVVIGAVAMSTATLPTLAAIAVTGQPYTMVSAILPTLVAAYTLATLMHLYAAVQRAQAARLSRGRCVDRALDETVKPGAFNVLTTGAGLLSLVLVPIPPVQVFGMAGAWGTLLVFVTVFFLVPPFLVHWDRRPWPVRGSGMNRLGRMASRVTLTSMRYPKTMVLGAVLVMLAVAPWAMQVKVETDLLAYFTDEHPVNRHTRLIESKLAGVTSLEISLRGEGRDSLQNVATLGAVRDFQHWLEALPEVDRSVSMVDLVEQMHWAMNGENPAFKTLPSADRLLRQYLLVYDGEDLYELVNRDFEHARIVLNLHVHGAKEIGRTIDTIREHVAEHPLPGLRVDIGGYGRLFADQVDLLVTGQLNSFSGAFLQILLFMAVLWRSLGAAALCMLPNLAPLYFIFVLMGAAGIHLDMATVMIAGVVLGITVDDTIHLYHGYSRRRRDGISPLLAIERSFQSSGRAVLAISLLLVSQFMLLTTSDFIPTANFGLMTAVGLLAGQAAELLLLPALLVLKDVRRTQATVTMTPGSGAANGGAWAHTVLLPRAAATSDTHPEDDVWAPTQMLARSAEGRAGICVLVCCGAACKARDAGLIWERLSDEQAHIAARGLGAGAIVVQTSCLGHCEQAPLVQVIAGGAHRCSARDAAGVVRQAREYLLGAAPPREGG